MNKSRYRVYFILPLAISLLSACTFVPQMKRQSLSDPIMQLEESGLEATVESHNPEY